MGPGDFFGEVALISGEPRNATIVAEGEVDTYVLGKTDFQTALATSQSFRDQLSKSISCAINLWRVIGRFGSWPEAGTGNSCERD